MSQRAALRAMDAEIMDILIDAGIADGRASADNPDGAQYWPKNGDTAAPGQPVDVLIDRDTRLYAEDDAEVATAHTVATFFLAQVDPKRGGTLKVGDEEFKVEAEVSRDESRVRVVLV